MKWRWKDLVAKLSGRPTPDSASPSEGVATPGAGQAPVQAGNPMAFNRGSDQPEAQSHQVGGKRNSGGVGGAAKIYARALVEMAEEKGQLDEISSEVRQLAELIRTQPDLAKLIASPAIATPERRAMLERLFRGKLSDTTYKFLQVVNGKNRLMELPNILTSFDELIAERRGIVEVDVYVAQRMDAAEAQAVAGRIGAALKKEVVLHQYVNPDLIGGLVIRVGDQLIDGSVATQLKNMRTKLIEAGRNRARQSQD